MARTVKEYDERYTEFLDVGQRLFYQKGYAQTSVQDIIGEMGVAKGLFYYYFSSKPDLLDAVIERMTTQILASLQPMIDDPACDAPTKMDQFFQRTQSWKLANREFLIDIMGVIYSDDNVLLRTKILEATMPIVVPQLARIIRQGMDEGVYDVAYPEESAEIVMELGQGLALPIANLLLKGPPEGVDLEEALQALERRVLAYERSIERVLGAADGSFCIVPPALLRAWFV
ncbi:MAG: TetR/AcrR family transcriptional regulator [Caldilinea sp.]|nr:TetR/AcrR family transcriptional regulator [Caldilinea sp.]